MKRFSLIITCIVFIFKSTQAQSLTENLIPFYLDSDGDGILNVVDTDDDNDSALDIDDYYPLDPNHQTIIIQSNTLLTYADAGIKNNSLSASNTNFGSAATVETKNSTRSLIAQFNQPVGGVLQSATLRLFGNTENDPLTIHFMPFSGWNENTITYNTTDFNGTYPIGVTTIPTANGLYSYEIPISALPSGGGDFSLCIYDINDSNIETLYTKETPGKAPRIDYTYTNYTPPRLVIETPMGLSTYVVNGSHEIKVKLSQQPTDTVWVPFAVSNTNASFSGPEVLKFTPENWDQFQSIFLTPSEVGMFDVYVKPLHSYDNFYNGHNPSDIEDFVNQSVNINNLHDWSVHPCETFKRVIQTSSYAPGSLDFEIIEGPSGLNVVEKTGKVTFRPLSHQINATYDVVIKVTDATGFENFFKTIIHVFDGLSCDPVGVFVDYKADPNIDSDGTPERPFLDIQKGVQFAAQFGGGAVYIRGVEHALTSIVNLPYVGSGNNPIIIQPVPGEHVKINFGLRSAFEFPKTARNIHVKGIEVDGNTDQVDFWCIATQAFYGDLSIPRGGGLAFTLDGDSINIINNYIHDCFQKAIEIRSGRYYDLKGNIIHNIATSSLSGGHGIMRQQKGDEFFTPDNLNDHRWDIYGNLIFNVEQRIYSWDPKFNFLDMVLDEGKPILIDDPKDTDGIADVMKARISHNLVAFGSLDHIRIKSTPNLEVSNNSVFYNHSDKADGITDRIGDTPTAQFTNFVFKNNAVQAINGTKGIEIDNAVYQAQNNPNSTLTVSGNYVANGQVIPAGQSGINILNTNQLFVDGVNGDFRLNPNQGLPNTLGADPMIIAELEQRAQDFGVEVKWDGWVNDDLKLCQTILDNVPYVYDGIEGNETVFTDRGHWNIDTTELDFIVVDGAWKAYHNINVNTHRFELNADYVAWIKSAFAQYKNANGQTYPRIRWGDSYIKQHFIFHPDELLVSTVSADTNTVVYGADSHLEVDGDIVVHFDGITPSPGDYFDLIIADTIGAVNASNLFDFVRFNGYTPQNYTFTIVDHPKGMAVRLSILNPGCNGLVIHTNDDGPGSLRAAIECAMDGDIITIDASLKSDTIKLTSIGLEINKSVQLIAAESPVYIQNSTIGDVSTAIGKQIGIENIILLSNRFINRGSLTCKNVIFKPLSGVPSTLFENKEGATFIVVDGVEVR